MQKRAILTVCALVVLMLVASCNPAADKTDKTISSAVLSSDAVTSEDSLAWRPDAVSDENSDVANRSAFGIIDSYDGVYYYQGECDDDCLYALYSYDSDTGEKSLLVKDCYGTINATSKGVFYIGYAEKGLFWYDYDSKTSKKVCSDDIVNAVICGNAAYIITSESKIYKVDLFSRDKTKIAENAAGEYLEINGDYVYFSQGGSDGLFELHRVSTQHFDTSCILRAIPMPVRCLGDRVICRSSDAVISVDTASGERSTLIEDDAIFSVGVNGNRVFYTRVDNSTGHTELFAIDIESKRNIRIMPVHCASIYFMDTDLYLVDAVDFRIEKANLSEGGFCAEWLIK